MYAVSIKLEKSLNSIGLNAQIVNTFKDTDILLVKRGVEKDLKLVFSIDNKISMLSKDSIRELNSLITLLIKTIFMEKFFVTTYDNTLIQIDKLIRLTYNDAVVPIIKIRVIGKNEYEVIIGSLFLPDERWLSTRVDNTKPITGLYIIKSGGMLTYKLILDFNEFMKAYEFKFSGLKALTSGLKLTSGLYSLLQRKKSPVVSALKFPVFKTICLNTQTFVMNVLEACKDNVEVLNQLSIVGYGFMTNFAETYLLGIYGNSPNSIYTKSKIIKGGLYSLVKKESMEFYNSVIKLLCNY